MKILVAYHSRSGHTEALAFRLRGELEARGHAVSMEKIAPVATPNKWRLLPPLWPALLLFPLFLWFASFRRWWFKRYPQAESDIQPLRHPDVSAFDLVCLGGPKWLYISYPLARYLSLVEGLAGKKVGAFATFCGPPLEVFELEMLFTPIAHRLVARGAELAATLAVSSHFHEFVFFREMEYLFRLVSRLRFGRPLRAFTLDSPWAGERIDSFCRQLARCQGGQR
jgi:hypothetical protein